MKILTLKCILWFCIIFSLALSFPIQVIANSPLPALVPYIGIGLVFLLSLVFEGNRHNALLRWNITGVTSILVTIYILLVFFHTGWQTVFGFITLNQGISAIVIYVLPVLFYVYFRMTAAEREIHIILLAIAMVGLAIGLYFAYDSLLIMKYKHATEFQTRALKYSIDRMGIPPESANIFRISGARSFGPLEKHTISTAWVALGCFAALTLLPKGVIFQRIIVIGVYSLLLFIGLNFTGIIGFALVIFLIEFGGIAWLRGRLSRRGIKVLGAAAIFSVLTGLLIMGTIDSKIFKPIQEILDFQIHLGIGKTTMVDSEHTYFEGFVRDLAAFPTNMLQFPPGFFIGDGFSVFAVKAKGGDYGLSETLHRFGLPFFLALMIGLIVLIRRAANQIFQADGSRSSASRYLFFALCVTIYLLFAEIHYTIWNAKSILPIFFLSLGLYQRYMPSGKRKKLSSFLTSAPSQLK